MLSQIDTNAPLTYLGTIDDVVKRFPWDEETRQSGFFAKTLIKAALTGNPILINDGYMFHHEDICDAIVNREASPLRALMDAGFVKILSRTPHDLTATPRKMAEAGVKTFKDLVESEKWPLLEKQIKAIEKELGILPWPPMNISEGFVAIVLGKDKPNNRLARGFAGLTPRALGIDVSQAVLDETLEEFARRTATDTGAPRTKWEDSAALIAQRRGLHATEKNHMVNQLMFLANSVYHVNFAACLSRIRPNVALETRRVPVFDELLLSEQAKEITEGETLKPLHFGKEDLMLLKKPRVQRALCEIVDPQKKLGQAKVYFLQTRKEYLQEKSEANKKSYEKAMGDYEAEFIARIGGTPHEIHAMEQLAVESKVQRSTGNRSHLITKLLGSERIEATFHAHFAETSEESQANPAFAGIVSHPLDMTEVRRFTDSLPAAPQG